MNNTWTEELKGLDSMANHQTMLSNVLEAYLTSDYANNKEERTKVIVLFNHLKKLE